MPLSSVRFSQCSQLSSTSVTSVQFSDRPLKQTPVYPSCQRQLQQIFSGSMFSTIPESLHCLPVRFEAVRAQITNATDSFAIKCPPVQRFAVILSVVEPLCKYLLAAAVADEHCAVLSHVNTSHMMLYFSSDPERPFPVHCTALRAKVNYSWILQRESVEIGGHFPISHPVLRCQHILKPALKLFLKCNSPAYIAKYSLEHLLHISTSRTLRTCHHR
nr:MAG TPA: hypothetical protein [Caudoviricetes sp.]